jgi:hypothetical protein
VKVYALLTEQTKIAPSVCPSFVGTQEGLFGDPSLEVSYVRIDLMLYLLEESNVRFKAVLHLTHSNRPSPARGVPLAHPRSAGRGTVARAVEYFGIGTLKPFYANVWQGTAWRGKGELYMSGSYAPSFLAYPLYISVSISS